MALDELKDTDDFYEVNGFKFIANKDFLEKAKPIKIDFSQMGFKLESGIELGAGCGGCETTGTCS